MIIQPGLDLYEVILLIEKRLYPFTLRKSVSDQLKSSNSLLLGLQILSVYKKDQAVQGRLREYLFYLKKDILLFVGKTGKLTAIKQTA